MRSMPLKPHQPHRCSSGILNPNAIFKRTFLCGEAREPLHGDAVVLDPGHGISILIVSFIENVEPFSEYCFQEIFFLANVWTIFYSRWIFLFTSIQNRIWKALVSLNDLIDCDATVIKVHFPKHSEKAY